MMKKLNYLVMLSYFLLSLNQVFARDKTYVVFFVSNNTEVITFQTAYTKLTGKEQLNLHHQIKTLLRTQHIQHATFKPLFGAYCFANTLHCTADNSEKINILRQKMMSEEQIFSMARALAVKLKQDSVAVFIPNQTEIGNISVSFKAKKPRISSLIHSLRNKLPPFYSSTFSLLLTDTTGSFNRAKVAKIEWLGSKLNLGDIRKSFPVEKIELHYGSAFLVYSNGKKERL